MKFHVVTLKSIMRKRRRFLITQIPVLLAWIGGAALIGILGWAMLLHTLEKQQADIRTAALNQAAAMSRGYADHLSRTLEAVDQTLLHVRFEWSLSEGNLKLENANEAGLFPSTSLYFVAITDAAGNVTTSTIPDNEKLNVADRPYFKTHLEGNGDILYFDAPEFTRTAGANVLQFTRRIEGRNGEFAGVVLAALAPDYLTANYDETTLGEHGLLGIVGIDQRVRVTRTGSVVHSARQPAFERVPVFNTSSGSNLFEGRRWFFDERSRYIGWQAVKGYPIVAVTGTDMEMIFSGHNAYRASIMEAVSWVAALIVLLTLTAMFFSLRLAWRKQELEATRAAYRMATEEGNEGFYIARAITNKFGQVVDFEIVDCNQRGADFFGQRRAELLGVLISRSPIGAVFGQRTQLLEQAIEEGISDVELQVPSSLNLAATWLHVRAVRAENEVAITLHDISDSKAHLDELERRSNEDALTGLPNRRWVQNHLMQIIEAGKNIHDGVEVDCVGDCNSIGVLYVDLDGFKTVNDTMGHSCGDQLLRAASQRLKAAIRPQDHLARIGNDEFVILIEKLSSKDDATFVAERIHAALNDAFKLSAGMYMLGASIGISIYPHDGEDAETLLQHADIAMYSVKTSGKGSFRFFDPRFYRALRDRIERESELRDAIEHDQFVMYYQPRIDINTGLISSMESLVRWQHPAKGFLGPNEFVPLAEETGLVVGMGTLIIDKVCAQIAQWQRTGQQLVPISINVSPQQFAQTDVVDLFANALERYGIDAELVEIEVTESSMMGDTDQISKTMTRLQEMGIKLLVDDFGTGYSSLAQLQRMDFDVVKVDRAFTSQIDVSEEGNIFVKAIITMAHALGMRVVAEGVENERQVSLLKGLACDEIQGFYISMPLPPMDRQPVLPRYYFRSAA